jgi:TolA-binding protein
VIDSRLSDAGNERERALLRVGADEAPSFRSVRAAARALGFLPGAATFFYVMTAFAKAAKWSTLGPYVLAPAVVAGVVATTYVAVERRSSNVDVAAPAVAATVAAPRDEAAAPPVIAPAVAPMPGSPLAALDEAVRAPRRAGSQRGPAREASGADVPAQVALVDRARALVAAGDTSGALRAADEYTKRFPRGALSEEAALLRIEAVYARGDRGAVAALARRFRAEYPRSVHADKLQWMLGDGLK